MPTQKRDRQWVSSRARAAAVEAERRRSMRKRLIGALIVGVLVIALLAGALLATRDGGGKAAATTTTSLETPTSAPVESAAGKPCVPLADPLPAGAPDVPVEVGPPPASLVTKDIKVGDGAEVTAGQTVKADYIGVSCSTGKIFDSSYKRGQPAEFPLANVIKGWQQGIPGMKVGGQRLLGIPPDLAYGDNPPPAIAAGETLWFVVQIVSAS